MAASLRTLGIVVVSLGVLAACGCPWEGGAASRPAVGGPGKVKIGGQELALAGPAGHENLAVFFLRGPNTLKGKDVLTLPEALERKVIIVHETGNVGELAIENIGELPVYIQGGEIVRGGRQDRMLPYDLMIKPKSGRQPLTSFCVEQGRWTGREGEAAGHFARSDNMANSRMKLAGMVAGDQTRVWAEVSKAQDSLSGSAGKDVRSDKSRSSMDLTYDDATLKSMVAAYEKALSGAPGALGDAVGCAVAVNGQVVSVDVYGSNVLFAKLWPKLLRNAAYSAIAEKRKDPPGARATGADVAAFIAKIDREAKENKTVAGDSSRLQMNYSANSARYSVTDWAPTSDDSLIPVAPAHTGYIKE